MLSLLAHDGASLVYKHGHVQLHDTQLFCVNRRSKNIFIHHRWGEQHSTPRLALPCCDRVTLDLGQKTGSWP